MIYIYVYFLAENAKFICNEYYGLYNGPQVKFIGEESISNFTYVPSHLHHMLFELLKNSLRAVVETYGVDCEEYPDIKMVFDKTFLFTLFLLGICRRN
jgi:pyruvate dehydrogenase kinase 2/3/4